MGKLSVHDLMTKEVEVVFDDEELDVADTVMTLSRIRHLPVTNRDSELVGLLTQRDLLVRARDLGETLTVADIMRDKVATVGPDTPIELAARLMLDNKYGCLLVLEEKRIVGIITETDFVEFVANNAAKLV